MFYNLTGCDTVSFFAGRGKKLELGEKGEYGTEVPTLPIFAEDFRFLCLVSAITIPINNIPIFAWTILNRPNIQCCNTILIPLCVFRGKNGGNDGGITAVFSNINTAFFHSFNSQSILLTPHNSANLYIDNMYQ